MSVSADVQMVRQLFFPDGYYYKCVYIADDCSEEEVQYIRDALPKGDTVLIPRADLSKEQRESIIHHAYVVQWLSDKHATEPEELRNLRKEAYRLTQLARTAEQKADDANKAHRDKQYSLVWGARALSFPTSREVVREERQRKPVFACCSSFPSTINTFGFGDGDGTPGRPW
jgi:hypothetical protein